MDQIKEVRKSIVRISFKWTVQREKVEGGVKVTSTEVEPMVHSGIIASINSDGCLIITTSVFFNERQFPETFDVHFPNENGYEPAVNVLTSSLKMGKNFTSFVLWSREPSFLKEVKFDTRILESFDEVFVFVFPRENYVTPTGYTRGKIVFADSKSYPTVCFQDSQFHEYGHLGAPVFNDKGYLVGICFNSQIRTHVWTVDHLKRTILSNKKRRISYVGA